MLSSFADFDRSVRDIVFENAPPDLKFCFSLASPNDVSANQAGDLFSQNEDFLLVETQIQGVRRAGVSWDAPRRIYADLTLSWVTKDVANDLEKLDALEEISRWFSEQTINGVRYRQLIPLGGFPLMGFMSYDGTLNCDFELRTAKR